MPTPSLASLQARLRYEFRDPGLLEIAVSHRSWTFEREAGEHYERLEFLGDAVLGAVASAWLYGELDRPEGDLSKLKSYLVSAPRLAEAARRLGIGDSLRLGIGEERSGGRQKESLLADALESVIGAVFLDGGYGAAEAVILPWLRAGYRAFLEASGVTDAKTTLQEVLQATGRELPDYVLVAEEGPDHEKTFVVDLLLDGEVVATGEGGSKKKAEQSAAAAALRKLSPTH